MRIIPAIDIIDGKCVRLTQGDYSQKKVYNENPLEVAKEFEGAGIQYLHLVDLDGAKAGKVTNWKIVESICTNTRLAVDFGGGIKKEEELSQLFDIGVTQVNLGSIAVKAPQLVYDWLHTFGTERIILSADVKDNNVAIGGWQEDSRVDLFDFIKQYQQRGITYVTCTDISTDGTLKGPNKDLYKSLRSHFPALKIVASGGVSAINDLEELAKTGVDGVIVGKAIYEGRISFDDLRQMINDARDREIKYDAK